MKNFSLIETGQGDFKLSPAYDLLNTKLHIDDTDFALKEGLLPKPISSGTIRKQFLTLSEKVGITEKTTSKILTDMTSFEQEVVELVNNSFLNEKLKRNFIQAYQTKLKKLKG